MSFLVLSLADAQTSMRRLHVASDVIERAASRRTQEIDEQLLLPAHAVFSAMLPEPFKLRVGDKPRQQVVRHRGDPIVATETCVERL